MEHGTKQTRVADRHETESITPWERTCTLFTQDCVAKYASSSIITFVDDTTVVGLIPNNDDTAYREEVRGLGVWCLQNNLSLNVNKTKEMIVNFRKQQREHVPTTSTGPQWRRWTSSSSSAYTSLTN
jgi:hypothetical protein